MTKPSSTPHKKTQTPFRPIDLTKDTVFQYFFTKHKSCLISLLHTFLPLPEERKITSLNILDPKLHPSSKNLAEKHSICDLKLTLNTGEKVNVEMQNFPDTHFLKRTLFYLSRLYTEGLKQGDDYHKLPDTYLVVLTNSVLFKQTRDYYSSFSFRRDQVPHFMFHRALRVVTVELGKFPERRISTLFDLKEQWCYMLKESARMKEEELNRLGERSEDMKQVTNHFMELSASEQDRLLEEHRQKSRLVLHGQREYVREKIHRQVGEYMKRMAEGTTEDMEIEPDIKEIIEQEIQESMEQIRKAGRKQGMKQATEQNMKQVALQMLKEKIDMDLISRVTGITKEKILTLKSRA